MSLPSRDFRTFFFARTISRWGDTFNSVAVVLLVYQLTGSAIDVGATVVLEIVPVLMFGLVAGFVADRFPRARLMIGADLVRVIIALWLALYHDDLVSIYLATFALSTATVFFNPAASTLLPLLVDADGVARANSALWSTAVLSQIVLAPLAGLLVATAGSGPAFAVNAASFLVSATLLWTLRATTSSTDPERRLARGQLAAGYHHVTTSRWLSTLGITHVLAALSAGATSALLVVLAERHLHIGSADFGILIASIGAGAAAGPLLVMRATREVRRPRWLFGPYLLRGVVDLALAVVGSFAGAVALLVGYGIGTSTGNVAYSTTLQTTVPDEVRGRVFAFYDVLWAAARILSVLAGGVLADRLGIASVYALGGCLMLLAGISGYVGVRGHSLTDEQPWPQTGAPTRRAASRCRRPKL